ncbi:NADH dehydrogenase, alpha subcomplex, subunit 2 [Meira miltonrushii]|uniref:NADH dehydrogenase, alpha subcomplex, subunit 2 n=1 Tax=Meira miltonrushii TaxID=1280837 RepID=A0A316VPE6_9BASI|nr:NADH dehydrogenase, alpha subcomplex, subunit 2 [Meira miltonrushii]PWN38283.1 NADH dehydrogenase, alpha subcomplex, subunit 2 [Meira miltonrushii]
MASTALSRAFPAALKEVRFHMCQSGQASAGARQFIESSYKSIKQSNPELPFLIREASGAPARIFARFDRGVEKHAELDGLSASDVEKKVTELISQGGKA